MKNNASPIHGWLVIDKPTNITSAQVVAKVRKALGVRKVGHAGTLDPLASGILPIAVGEATKTTDYVMSTTKTYMFEICWGEQRTTDDSEGSVIATSDVRPSATEIKKALPSFIGEIAQVPPIFSAIKVKGRRAYQRARAHEEVVLPPRNVVIKDFRLLTVKDSEHASFEVICGKGTYVRSLARDLGIKLGTLGYVSQLRRTQVGRFGEDMSISLETLQEIGHKELSKDVLLSIEAVLDDILAVRLTSSQALKLSQGQSVNIDPQQANSFGTKQVLCTCENRIPIALAEVIAGSIKPKRVFNISLEV